MCFTNHLFEKTIFLTFLKSSFVYNKDVHTYQNGLLSLAIIFCYFWPLFKDFLLRVLYYASSFEEKYVLLEGLHYQPYPLLGVLNAKICQSSKWIFLTDTV